MGKFWHPPINGLDRISGKCQEWPMLKFFFAAALLLPGIESAMAAMSA